MNTKINNRRARALTCMLSLGMLAGMLIWAKLRLVTDIPRSALAEPKQIDKGQEPRSMMNQPAENAGGSGVSVDRVDGPDAESDSAKD